MKIYWIKIQKQWWNLHFFHLIGKCFDSLVVEKKKSRIICTYNFDSMVILKMLSSKVCVGFPRGDDHTALAIGSVFQQSPPNFLQFLSRIYSCMGSDRALSYTKEAHFLYGRAVSFSPVEKFCFIQDLTVTVRHSWMHKIPLNFRKTVARTLSTESQAFSFAGAAYPLSSILYSCVSNVITSDGKRHCKTSKRLYFIWLMRRREIR